MTSFPRPAARAGASVALACVSLAAFTLAACGPGHQARPGFSATDEWKRSYTLTPGGELELSGRSGSIEIHGGSGDVVEVHADRVAHAATEASARELLPRIEMREEVTPGRVAVATEGLGGLVIGVEVEVNYRVTAPASARLRIRGGSGAVSVTGMSGGTSIEVGNGSVTVKDSRGGLQIRAVNGDVTADAVEIGPDPVEMRSTNGNLTLTIPKDAGAYLLANFTSGAIDTDGLTFEPAGEQARRRMRGRINGGGTPIELVTVRGNIQVHPRP